MDEKDHVKVVEFDEEETDKKDATEIILAVTLTCKITYSNFLEKYQVKANNKVLEEFQDIHDAIRWCKENL